MKQNDKKDTKRTAVTYEGKILTSAQKERIQYAKVHWSEAKNSQEKFLISGPLLQDLKHFLCLNAANYATAKGRVNDEVEEDYELRQGWYARDSKKGERDANLVEIYQKYCMDLVDGVGLFGTPEFLEFKKQYFDPLLKMNGFSKLSLIALISTFNVFDKNVTTATEKFMDAENITSFSNETLKLIMWLNGLFKKLFPTCRPPTGKTWKDVLDEFILAISKHDQDTQIIQSTQATQAPETQSVHQEHEDAEITEDNKEKETTVQSKRKRTIEPDNPKFLPAKTGWLAFVFYGSYGTFAYGTLPLENIMNYKRNEEIHQANETHLNDEIQVSRERAKKAKTTDDLRHSMESFIATENNNSLLLRQKLQLDVLQLKFQCAQSQEEKLEIVKEIKTETEEFRKAISRFNEEENQYKERSRRASKTKLGNPADHNFRN